MPEAEPKPEKPIHTPEFQSMLEKDENGEDKAGISEKEEKALEKFRKDLEEATAEEDDAGVAYNQGRIDVLTKKQKKGLSPDQLQAGRVKVAANSHLAACKEKLVSSLENFVEAGKNNLVENDKILAKAREEHVAEITRIEKNVKEGKLEIEKEIAEINVKIQTQAEKFRQGTAASHNVIAEVRPESGEEEEEEEEEEEKPAKDEYVAARNEENYSTFRAQFMSDPRLQAESASNREDFMAAMWKEYDFVPKPKEGEAFMPCTKDREAEKDRRRRARKVRDANDMDAAGSDNTARAPGTKRDGIAASSTVLKKGGTVPTSTDLVLVQSPQQAAAAEVEAAEQKHLAIQQAAEAAAAATAAAEAAATAATAATAAQLDLNNNADAFAYT